MIEYLNQIIHTTEVTWESSLIRFLISFFLGALVGIERETHNQPAGLRTHILISIGSTMAMLISIYIPQTFTDFQNGDPGRIAAQVISGIGFLGAGAILRFGANVKGLTTAASIWATASVGLAVGAGMYVVGIIGVVVILFALTIMNLFEKIFFKERTLRRIILTLKKYQYDIDNYKIILENMDISINSIGFDRNANDTIDKITLQVGVTHKLNVHELIDIFEKQPGFISVSFKIDS